MIKVVVREGDGCRVFLVEQWSGDISIMGMLMVIAWFIVEECGMWSFSRGCRVCAHNNRKHYLDMVGADLALTPTIYAGDNR